MLCVSKIILWSELNVAVDKNIVTYYVAQAGLYGMYSPASASGWGGCSCVPPPSACNTVSLDNDLLERRNHSLVMLQAQIPKLPDIKWWLPATSD